MRRYRRSYWREVIAVAGLILLGLLRWWSDGEAATDSGAGYARAGLEPGVYRVERVIDGDTLLLSGGQGRVRLQGVNTPETVKPDFPVERWGPEASEFTKAFIRAADDTIRIEIDGEPLDQHGRFLGFVWDGDRLLNEELVRAGLAYATLQYDFSSHKKHRLGDALREAKKAQRGIWSPGPSEQRPSSRKR
jgi:endonuclease YncB( thermonuclease family)